MNANIQKSSLSPTSVRFSESEKDIIQKAADKERRTRAEFIRLAAIDHAVSILEAQSASLAAS